MVLQMSVKNSQSSCTHYRKTAWAQPSTLVSSQPFLTTLSSFWWSFLAGKGTWIFHDMLLGTAAIEKTPVLVKCLLSPGCRSNIITSPEFTVSFVEHQVIILDFQSAPWIFKAVKGVRTNKSASSSLGTSIWAFGPNPANCISIWLYVSGRAALLELRAGPTLSRSRTFFLNWKFLMKQLLSSFILSSQPDLVG